MAPPSVATLASALLSGTRSIRACRWKVSPGPVSESRRVVRRRSRVASRASSRASRRLNVARGTPSSAAARDSDPASTVRVNARSSAVSTGSLIWIIFDTMLPFVGVLAQAGRGRRVSSSELIQGDER